VRDVGVGGRAIKIIVLREINCENFASTLLKLFSIFSKNDDSSVLQGREISGGLNNHVILWNGCILELGIN
jgi:hypothetical protein